MNELPSPELMTSRLQSGFKMPKKYPVIVKLVCCRANSNDSDCTKFWRPSTYNIACMRTDACMTRIRINKGNLLTEHCVLIRTSRPESLETKWNRKIIIDSFLDN